MSLMIKNNRDPFALLTRNFFNGWDPFRELGTITKQASVPAFVAKFDVKETDDAYLLRADLPGVKKDDLDVTLDKGVLTISGKRDEESTKEGETYHVYERSYGSFTRSFRLPDLASGEGIDADLSNGVLEVTIPKRAEAKPTKIELK